MAKTIERSSKRGPPVATSANSSDNPSNEEIERALEYLLSHRVEAAQQLLAEAGRGKPKRKSDLQKQILRALADDAISPQQITDLLDEIEGWGNQHVQLLLATDALCDQWLDRRKGMSRLKKAGLDALVGERRPIWLPDEPQLVQVHYDAKRMRLTWAQQRTWELREKDLDYEKAGVRFKAYRIQHRRSLCHFDWDIVSGEAAVIMQKLPSGQKYDTLQQYLLDEMSSFLDVAALQPVGMRKAIRELEKSRNVSRRSLKLSTQRQTEIAITSHERLDDAYADPPVKEARKRWGTKVAARRGFFYWQTKRGKLSREIGMRVYPNDNRFSIESQCTEEEVRYVLQSMRAIS